MCSRERFVVAVLLIVAFEARTFALQVYVDAVQAESKFIYTVFNNQPLLSPNHISIFHLAIDAPITVAMTPVGWSFETDNSTYVDWFNSDAALPYPHDIAPQASLTFAIETPVTRAEILTYAVSTWDHVVDDAGPSFEDLVLAPVRIVGDFDLNGYVDGGDVLVWQQSLGTPPNLAADANLDGIVDGDDLLIWRDNYGEPGAGNPISRAPEPSSLFLFGFAVIGAHYVIRICRPNGTRGIRPLVEAAPGARLQLLRVYCQRATSETGARRGDPQRATVLRRDPTAPAAWWIQRPTQVASRASVRPPWAWPRINRRQRKLPLSR